jgi:hypothetical protein
VSAPAAVRDAVSLSLPGWVEVAPRDRMRVWTQEHGAILSLNVLQGLLPDLRDADATLTMARAIAQGAGAGLIEAEVLPDFPGPACWWIYKRLQVPAYVFTAMLFVRRGAFDFQWTVVHGERGLTGVREAEVAAELLSSGAWSVRDDETAFLADPYDPGDAGVDRSVLRFVSDHPRYDARFPDHPLSIVRRAVAALPASFEAPAT